MSGVSRGLLRSTHLPPHPKQNDVDNENASMPPIPTTPHPAQIQKGMPSTQNNTAQPVSINAHCTSCLHHTERRARINCHASQRLPWTDTLSILFTQRHLQTWKEVRIRDCPILEIEVGSYVTLWGLLLLSHVQLQRRCTAAAIGLCFCPVCVIQTA